MLGAICGDVIGNPYEFGKMKNYDFDLFTDESKLTDDSFMTAAIAAAILQHDAKLYDFDKVCAERLEKFARSHPDAGYGGMFKKVV